MRKMVVFDLDGTLLDTLPDISYYVNQTLVKFGYPTHEDDKIMQFIFFVVSMTILMTIYWSSLRLVFLPGLANFAHSVLSSDSKAEASLVSSFAFSGSP